jgi:hypothetical protein
LYLNNLTSIPKGFNPTVSGSLELSSLTFIPEGFNPTVGGNFYLNKLTSIPKGFNPTVGGKFYLNKLIYEIKKITRSEIEKLLIWENGKYKIIDGIFCEVLSTKNNISKVKINNKTAYVYSKNDISAHGETLKEAYEDWIFKNTETHQYKEKLEEYKKLKLIDIKPIEYWATCYRLVTNACKFGTKNFIENSMDKKEYSLQEIIKLTYGQYNSEIFEKFFKLDDIENKK